MSEQKSYDIIVYGATGYTGKLVCEHIVRRSKNLPDLTWAIAGRSLSKLEKIREELGVKDLPLVVADTSDSSSLDAMVASTNLVMTTVGPYQKYGTPLVKACAESGTDYVDLCGEPIWMREMIETYESVARDNGARILFCCGFDSIPSELGVWTCQQEANRLYGKPMPLIRGRVRSFIGGPSGGTMASWVENMKLIKSDPTMLELARSPFALTPGFSGPEHPRQTIRVEPDVGPVGPFNLGPTNMKNVHRSNFLMGHPYGENFVYDELEVGVTEKLELPSIDEMPSPGEGPSKDVRMSGEFDLLFIGSDHEGNEVRTSVMGTRDAGYECTSRMMFETALCLTESDFLAGGIFTPGAVLKETLIDRLELHAFMQFKVE